MRYPRFFLITAAVAITSLTACTDSGSQGNSTDPGPTHVLPSGAVTLQQNIPTRVTGGELVAYNLAADSAWLSIVDSADDAPAETVRVTVGDTFTIGSDGWTVHTISADDADPVAPGAGPGTVVVAPNS